MIAAVLALGVLSGCVTTQKKTDGGIDLIKGSGEAVTLYNSLAVSMPLLTAAPTELLTKIPASVTVITADTVYENFVGIISDNDFLEAGILLASQNERGSFVITEELTVTQSVTVASNVILCFRGEGKINLGAGAHLYFENGSEIIAGKTKIFSGNVNNISLIADPENSAAPLSMGARPEWFGASSKDGLGVANCDSAAISAAISFATKVYLSAGEYLVNSTVTLPTSHSVELIGSGRNASKLVLGGEARTYFVGNGSNVGFYDMNIEQIGHLKTASFLSLVGGELTLSAVACYGIANVFTLTDCTGLRCEYLFANSNVVVFNANGCTDMNFISSLGNSNKNFLVATNCSNITAVNSSSVWNYGTDYTFYNCHGIVMNALGCDLGYDRCNGQTGEIYELNQFAIYMSNCYDFTLKNLWVASNYGLSKTHAPLTDYNGNIGAYPDGVHEASNRTGICLVGCYKGSVAYCTITNHAVAVKISASPDVALNAGNEIVFLGNQFVGNVLKEVMMNGARNIAFHYNSHKQYHAGEFASCDELDGAGCSNVAFIGETFYGYNSIAELQARFVNSTGILFNSIIDAKTGNVLV